MTQTEQKTLQVLQEYVKEYKKTPTFDVLVRLLMDHPMNIQAALHQLRKNGYVTWKQDDLSDLRLL